MCAVYLVFLFLIDILTTEWFRFIHLDLEINYCRKLLQLILGSVPSVVKVKKLRSKVKQI